MSRTRQHAQQPCLVIWPPLMRIYRSVCGDYLRGLSWECGNKVGKLVLGERGMRRGRVEDQARDRSRTIIFVAWKVLEDSDR